MSNKECVSGKEKLVKCNPQLKRVIPWTYCECGCHQSEVRIGTFSCSLFTDSFVIEGKQRNISTTRYRLAVPSHSYDFEYFNSWKDVEDRVISLIKKHLQNAEASIQNLKKIVQEYGKLEE